MAINSINSITHFTNWTNQVLHKLEFRIPPEAPFFEVDLPQSAVFSADGKRLIWSIPADLANKLGRVAQSVAIVAATPFALIADAFRACTGNLEPKQLLNNITFIPKCSLSAALHVAGFALSILNGVSTAVGFLAWHAGEWAVRKCNGSETTVLSRHAQTRDIVYNSQGITLLSLGASFVPFAPVALTALPIIMGSIYGTLNNQFTVRNCPEYYTMGHYYNGTSLEGHAVRTNNLIIKPLVTGSYATTFVTTIAGGLLSAVGTLPYTAARSLPVPLAAAMIGGVSLISLVAGHILAERKKAAIQANLKAYADHLNFEWTEERLNKTWSELHDFLQERIYTEAAKFNHNEAMQDAFLEEARALGKKIMSDISTPDLPIKYVTGWASNNTRNLTGYIAAGAGTVSIAIATVFLRLFVLRG